MPALVYERQGHGKSSSFTQKRERQYLHREALEVLPALIEELKIKQPILIGHSDGGSIALIFAAHHRPVAVVTIAAHIFVESITLSGIRETLRNAVKVKKALRPYHGEKTDPLFDAWHETWLGPGFHDWAIEKEIGSITCPVLAIQGTEDPYGSEAQIAGILNAVGDQASAYWVTGGGHLPHLEQSRILSEKICTFIARLTRKI